MRQLFAKKPMERVLEEAGATNELKRSLTALSLILLGIGAIIGAGLFVRTADAVADSAGPSVTISFLLAGIGCSFAGLCYAELASRIPISGSAYTYSYVTMGELIAWIIGWDLILEYALGAGTVAIGLSQYLNKLLGYIEINGQALCIPYEWCHSPFHHASDAANVMHHGIFNLPACCIVLLLSILLVRGTSGSVFFNNLIVIMKVAIIILFILIGWQFINPANHDPYIPARAVYVDNQGISHDFGGIPGILGAAGTVFFAFIGFDAISTAVQETVNPKRNMPIGILGSLIICTILYILFSFVLTGVATVQDFRTVGEEASITYAVQTYMTGYTWLAQFITVAILIGLSSALLVMLMAQSRIFYSMSRDGLLPKFFSDIHPRFNTPYKSSLLVAAVAGLIAGLVPGTILGNMTSIATLFAFILVCGGLILLRYRHPETHSSFRTPFVPITPILGIMTCGVMIYGLGLLNWLRLLIWLVIGLVVYCCYSRKHSRLTGSGR
jgi:APA family basic amino acid/polyamine antiporter